MNKIQTKKEQLHAKTAHRTNEVKRHAHRTSEKTANKSSDLIHKGIDLAAKAVKNISESVKKHLPD